MATPPRKDDNHRRPKKNNNQRFGDNQRQQQQSRPERKARAFYEPATPKPPTEEDFADSATLPLPPREEGSEQGTTEQGDNFIYGRRPVLEALQRGEQFEKVFLLQGTRGEFEKEVRHACRDANIPLQIVPKEKLHAMTEHNHQGIIGIISPIAYQDLEEILSAAEGRQEVPLVVLLDGVTDVRNIGAIARSAEISGAHALVVSKKNVAAINADAVKTSAGALHLLPVCRVSSLLTTVEWLRKKGIQCVAAEMQSRRLLRQVDFTLPTAIVMGAEGTGINRDLMRAIDGDFRIPMRGKTSSFNVSVATGIVLYESLRQRGE